MSKWLVIIFALVGLGLGVYTVVTSVRDEREPEPAAPPTVNPYARAVAATGVVEAASRNVRVGAPEPGLVTAVHVQVGDTVQAGDALFALDARPIESQLVEARAAVSVAEATLAQLQAAPRPEQLPILEAQVAQAEANAALARRQFERVEQLVAEQAAPREQLDQRRFEQEAAAARVAEAEATLAEARAGTWERELAVARAQLSQARARVEALAIQLERRTVRAPIAGTVLKRRVEPGEHLALASGEDAAMVLGDLSSYHVRAQVDEQDIGRVQRDATAVARVRGLLADELPLRMLRIEPFAEPKRHLTGVATELVDTRVVDVIFVVEQTPVAIYPGQLVDVFIADADEAQ
ncbi:MAG: HlyD family efflux transporter periplasmic adaptor subunit [Phycisphaeraceae bacterium]